MDTDRLSIKEMAEYTGADRARERDHRVRATLAPRPERHYPTPWRVAEEVSGGLVVDANNNQVADATSREAAEAIVLAVNTFAGVA